MPTPRASCPSYASHLQAKETTLRALLNSYLRETGCHDPRHAETGLVASLLDVGDPFRLQLSAGELVGTLRDFSLSGQHRYGAAFYLRDGQGRVTPLDMQDIIQRLLESLSEPATDNTHELRLWDMRDKINNSFTRMAAHIDDFHHHRGTAPEAALDFIAAEQSLYLGHPFHPFPKCSQGVERRAFDDYSPERGACFQLHYLAVRRDLLVEAWLDGPEDSLADAVHEVARQWLGERYAHYALLPIHPWQAGYLLSQPDILLLLEEGLLVDLGAQGPLAYPTSSVRSVWLPETGQGYKLPLQVRITNLIRENTIEQSRRTLDAARLIHRLRGELESDAFQVVMETGYRTLDPEHPALDSHRAAAFTVIYRPMPVEAQDACVLASLLEPYPGEVEPKLIAAIRHGAGGEVDLDRWFAAYLEVSLVPILEILARTGVSFEAHLQNSLLRLERGWPSTLYVRDLEGVSLDRERVTRLAAWPSLGIAADSPLLYSPEVAWRRTQYYFFVNHLGGVVNALATHLGVDEGRFWRQVGNCLERLHEAGDSRLTAYAEDLLQADHWPAKANLLSCFRQRGASPLFVDIVNPIKRVG
ncbi:IucA/IucC family protein [Billgrantia bachuensis]|uniref:Short-chain oxidoreductase n=1 Tax=Billgrantia bachuensis TaxID=2717286 RepID=A0ABX0PW65_9GAMM|nr:IucA/IucC family protein [Halomonas bachuensis]NIC06715.1 short-chain oxidoreductase [Halomonas bachuensis]